MVSALVLVAALVHTSNLHGVLAVTFVNGVDLAMALHVVVAHNGAKRLLGRGNCIAGRHDVKHIFRGISVQALTSIDLLQLRNVSTAAMAFTRVLIVSYGDFSHQ